MQNINILIKKGLVFPTLPSNKGNSSPIARQLDLALQKLGFKLSHALFQDIAKTDFEGALSKSQRILSALKELIGEHVAHNVYFIDFPKNIPDTAEFWFAEICKLFFTGDCAYGSYQHTYEEMLEAHSKLDLKTGKFKVINLGLGFEEEISKLFIQLAASNIPLSKEDQELLNTLVRPEYLTNLIVPIRENKAILNSIRIRKFNTTPTDIDSPGDVLRLACALSDGDVTLATTTKFKSLSRPVRRFLVTAINDLLVQNPAKIEDISNNKEPFKRLAEKLHPREFPQLTAAQRFFNYAYGSLKLTTFAHKVYTSTQDKQFKTVVSLLAQKPGQLWRSVDKILRECKKEELAFLQEKLTSTVEHVSGRVLLSTLQHLNNRLAANSTNRLFINKQGRAHVEPNLLPSISAARLKPVQAIISTEIERRLPAFSNLLVSDDLAGVAMPLTEKNKSAGFNVLPRGSRFELDGRKTRLRFFVYWHEDKQRTDYDLSCVFMDKNFNFLRQLSWTNLREDNIGVHSGDLTSSANGATEFIELYLNKLPADVCYIIPTVNVFAGEKFTEVKECFFGFMERSEQEGGKPFEAATVKTKFELRGEGSIALPMVVCRTPDGTSIKWIDLTLKGLSWGNRVESNSVQTSDQVRAIVEKEFLPFTFITDILKKKAAKNKPKITDPGLTYIGLLSPEGLATDAKAFTLNSFKELIPD